LRKYLKRLRKKTPRGGIVYFLEFSTLKSFFYLFAFETKEGQLPPPPLVRGLIECKKLAFGTFSFMKAILYMTLAVRD
jgi:hypothetical protein